jgi:hypothetical protein
LKLDENFGRKIIEHGSSKQSELSVKVLKGK